MYFTPEIFPEMTVYFEYSPGEKQTRDHPGSEEEFEFYEIEIFDKTIGPDLEDHLIEYFQDAWIGELQTKREDNI